jgi:hypothetical protein
MKKFALAMSLAVAAASLAGCHGSATADSASGTAADQAKPGYTVIQRGRPPISTMVTVTGQVEVADLTADKIVLKKRDIAPNTLITMNPGSLTFNMKQVSDGPFSRQHTYEFRLYR